MNLRRRDFLLAGGAAGAVLAGGVLVPVGMVILDDGSSGASGAILAAYPTVRIGSLAALGVGEPVWFDYPWEGASNLLVDTGVASLAGVGDNGSIVAFSNQCTHMGCPVTEYQTDTGVLGPCPCHYSSFDLTRDGVASFGQATQNLPRIRLEIDGDDINATGVFRLIYGHADNHRGEQLVEVRA